MAITSDIIKSNQLNPTTTNTVITIVDIKTNQPIQGVKIQVITPPNTP